jgi:hypothetical protein
MADKNDIQRLIDGLENQDEAALEKEFGGLYLDEDRSFGTGFADRVLARTHGEASEKGMDYFVPRLFRWVAVAGVAAAVILLTMTYINTNDLSIDALSGINEVSVEEVASLNF